MSRNVLLIMSLSGSIISVVCFIVYRLYFLEFKSKWLRNLFLLAIPFYLFPMPLFKYYLHDLLTYLGLTSESLIGDVEGSINKTYMVVDQQREFTFSLFEKVLLVSMIVMAIVSSLFILFRICQYIYLRTLAHKCEQWPFTKQETDFLNELKREIRVKKRIKLIRSPNVSTPFTIGIICPIVAIPTKLPETTQAFQMVLRHELSHIKHRDALWSLIFCLTLCLHWFNPVCYAFFLIFKDVAELYCDEDATSSLTKAEKHAYCSLLIELSKRGGLKWNPFTFYFGDAQKQMKRRIDNIMNVKKGKLRVAVALGCVMLNLGIGSTFVYADAAETELTFGEDYCFDFEENFHMDSSNSVSDTILYNDFFTDTDGNIYPCTEIETRVLCNHNYVNGTRTVHQKIGKGCKMDYYHAKRCTKCGRLVSYDKYSTQTWVTCPH